MIITRPIDGTYLIKTYSDLGYLIRQEDTGRLYASAIDAREHAHTYTETNLPIVSDPEQLQELINEQQEINWSLRQYSVIDELNSLKTNFSQLQETNDILTGCLLEMSEIVYE